MLLRPKKLIIEGKKYYANFLFRYYLPGEDPIVFHIGREDYVSELDNIPGIEQYNCRWGVYGTAIKVFPESEYYEAVKAVYLEALEREKQWWLKVAWRHYLQSRMGRYNFGYSLHDFFDLLEKQRCIQAKEPLKWGEVLNIVRYFQKPNYYFYGEKPIGADAGFLPLDAYVTVSHIGWSETSSDSLYVEVEDVERHYFYTNRYKLNNGYWKLLLRNGDFLTMVLE